MQPTHIFTNGCSFLTQRPKEGVDTHVGMELAKMMGLETACHLGGGGRGNKRCSITTKVWCESNKEIAEKCIKINNSRQNVISIPRNGPMPHNGYRAFDTKKLFSYFQDFEFTQIDHGLKETLSKSIITK